MNKSTSDAASDASAEAKKSVELTKRGSASINIGTSKIENYLSAPLQVMPNPAHPNTPASLAKGVRPAGKDDA